MRRDRLDQRLSTKWCQSFRAVFLQSAPPTSVTSIHRECKEMNPTTPDQRPGVGERRDTDKPDSFLGVEPLHHTK